MTNVKRTYAFLCHATEDKPAVRKYYERLRKDGVDAWIDEEELLPGQDWQLEISKAVKESEAVIVFLSRQSVKKAGFIQKEIKQALDVAKEKPEGIIYFIPVRLDECTVPNSLQTYQWVNLYDDKGYEKLMRALKTRIDVPDRTSLVFSDRQTIAKPELAQVTIVLEKDFLKFTANEKENFVYAISNLIGVPSNQIRILQVAEGSIIITLEMPETGARTLFEMYDKNDVEIEKLSISKIDLNLLGVLDGLIGLDEVKEFIRQKVRQIEMEKRHNKNFSSLLEPLVFTGNPGTGKTTIAYQLSKILAKLGYIKKEHFSEVRGVDFISGYVGQTASKTRETVEQALDGVLFVDEAYTMSSTAYGQEALNEIISLMEKYKNRILFIFSGYKNEMNKFLEENPEFSRKIAHVLDFPDFTEKQLLEILDAKASEIGFILLPAAKEKAEKYLAKAQNPYFGNARVAMNLAEAIWINHAERMVRENVEIKTRPEITSDDVP